MNRVFKFRAWDKEENKMYYNAEYTYDYYGSEIPEFSFGSVLDSDDYIVMEYTGLKDRNGKEIYEGDIDKYGYIVTYVADINESLGMNCGWYLQRNDFESWSPLECDSNEIEIIGNIFETPRLAKL